MSWLNFHHLLLFTTLIREGSLVAAGKSLRLSHSTLSAQVHALEESLGKKLVVRQGRRLVATEVGRVVFRYGEQIFDLGRELVSAVEGQAAEGSRLRLGIVDVVPKLVVKRLLEPLLVEVAGRPRVHLVCLEDTHARLLAQLGLHEIDLILSDAPSESGSAVRAYNHPLGSCEVSFFGAGELGKLREGFPRSLHGAPLLLPIEGTALRRSLNVWMASNGIRPRVVGEVEDSALLEVLGRHGAGVFPAPAAIERDVERQYGVTTLGRVSQVRTQFYGISLERRLKDPSVAAIFGAARDELFQPPRRRRARAAAR